MARDAQIQMRRDTAANWTSTNPTLAAGEYGFESDTGLVKIGDGTTAWTSLQYTQARVLDALTSQDTTMLDVFPRFAINGGVQITNQQMRTGFFTPYRNFTASNISVVCSTGGTDSGGTSVRRLGLFTVSGSTITLVARTANTPSIGNTSSTLTAYPFDTTGGFPATYALTAGTRYAVGMVAYNTGGTFNAPTMGVISYNAALTAATPRIGGLNSSQTDLPTTATVVGDTSAALWARLT